MNPKVTRRTLLPAALLAAALGAMALTLVLTWLAAPSPAVAQNTGVEIGFDATTYSAREGSSGTVRVAVTSGTLSAPISFDVVVPSSPAFPGGRTIQATITPPATSVEVTVNAPDNRLSGNTLETSLTLGNLPQGVTAASGSASAVFFVLDDFDPVATVRFVGDLNPTHPEGETVTLTAALQPGLNATRTISIQATVTGESASRVLTIESGANSATIDIVLPQDNVAGMAPETVTVTLIDRHPLVGLMDTLRSEDYDVVSGDGSSVAITVADDDAGVEVGFGEANYRIAEGSRGNVGVEVKSGTLSAPISFDVVVSSGPALPGGRTLQATITPPATSVDVALDVPDNEIFAPFFRATLTLANLPAGVMAAAGSDSAVLFVQDNNDPLARVQFETPTIRATEGETVTVTLSLEPRGNTPVVATQAVTVTVNDGEGFTQDVTIPMGESSTTFEYPAPDDDDARVAPAPRTLTLLNPVNGELGAVQIATISFRDDNDPIATVRFVGEPTRTAAEGTRVELRAELQPGLSATRTIRRIQVQISGGLTLPVRNLRIEDNTNFGIFNIDLPTDDVADMAPMAVVVQLLDEGTEAEFYNVVSGAGSSVTITVTDDDEVSVGFGAASYTATEGASVTVPVELKGATNPTNPITITVEDVPDPSPGAPDRTVNRTVTLSDSIRSADVTFTAPDDNNARAAPDDVTLTLSVPQGVNVAAGLATATVRLSDDGDRLARIAFMTEDRTQTVVEGAPVTLRVMVIAGTPTTRAIDVRVTGFPGSPSSRQATIQQGQDSATITFNAPDNNTAGVVPGQLNLRLEVAGNGDEAEVDTNGAGALITMTDQETLVVGEAAGEQRVHDHTPHRWDFVVSGTERQFVILQATGDDPTGTKPARVRGRLFDSTGALVAESDNLTRWGPDTVSNRHKYFRIERWLDPGNYVLEVRTDSDAGAETYGILADTVDPDANTLTFGATTSKVALTRTGSDPLQRRSIPYYYRLEVPEFMRGVPVTIESTTDSDPVARLLDSQGGFIAESSKLEDDTTGNMFMFRRVLAPGVYYLAVQSFVSDTTDDLNPDFSDIRGVEYRLSDPIGFTFTGPRVVRFSPSNPSTAPENEAFTLMVELADGRGPVAGGNLTLNVEYADGGNYAGPATVTIPNGSTSGMLPLTVPGDTVVGTQPTPLKVMLRAGSNAAPLQTNSATVITLTENDPIATVRFVGNLSPSGAEGTTVALRAELLNSVVATQALRVQVRITGGIMRTRFLNFDQGQNASRVFNVDLPSDDIQGQAPAAVVATLEDAGAGRRDYNVMSGESSTVTITVVDNDVVSVGFGAASYTVTEGSGTVTVPVGLQGTITPANAIMVTVTIDNLPGGQVTSVVTLSDSIGSADVTFTAPDDELHAPPPPVTLEIVNPSGFEVATNLGMSTVSFTDEGDPIASVGFMSPPTQLDEGEQVTLNLALMAGGPATRAITVRVSDGVTGGFRQMVTIQSGQDSASFSYTAPNDQDAHIAPPTRTLQLMLNPTVGMLASGSDSASIIYRDDGDALATVGFVNPPTRLTEGATEMLSVVLEGGAVATRAIMVSVSDGRGFNETMTIQRGQSSTIFTYTAPNDQHANIAPATRTLQLMMDPTFGILASGSAAATISFRDDGDALAVVRFVDPPSRLTEDEQVTLSVALEGGARATRAITVAVMDGRGFSETVTIQPGQSSTSFSFTAPGDLHANIAPPTRTLQLMLDPMVGMLASGAASAASISFRDDGDALAVVGFAPRSDRQILQGGRVTFVAQLQGGVKATRAVDVQLMFSDGRAPETVTIEQGQSMVEYVLRTTSSGPTPPPLRLTIGVPGGQALNADAASATLMQIPPVVGAEVPSAGGLELGWGALAALLAFALALTVAGTLLLTPRRRRLSRRLSRNSGWGA